MREETAMDGFSQDGARASLPADPMIPRPFRIIKVKKEVPGVFT